MTPERAGNEAAGRGGGSGLRPPVAVLLSRFPLVTETFILREIDELERQGQPVRLVPLLPGDEAVVHPEARPWIERALTTPFLSAAIAGAAWRRLRRDRRRTLALLARLLAGCRRSPGVLLRTLALFPKALYLAERLAAEGIGHLHAHFATYPATVAYVISQLEDISYSVTVHAHDLFVDRCLLREKLRRARWVRAVSRYNRDTILGLFPELDADRVRVLHVGLDPTPYAAAGAVAIPSTGPPVVLAIAALKPYKGLPVLLRACALLRQRGIACRCEIVGEGPERRALVRQRRRLGLGDRVRLLGALPQREVAEALARATVVVLPSVVAADGQMEGIPVVLMEGMAARRPVVASDLSGIPELVEHGVTGTLVPPGDPAALAAALERLLLSPAARAATVEAAARRVDEEFRLDRTTAELRRALGRELPALPGELVAAAAAIPALSAPTAWLPRAIWRRQDSTVARLGLAGRGAGEDLILKVHRGRGGESRPRELRARDEWERLVRLRGLFRSERGEAAARLGVPRPLAVAPDAGAVLMSACHGEPGDERLRRARWSAPRQWRRCLDELGLAGQWLARFHAAWPVSTGGAQALARLLGESVEALEEDRELDRGERQRLRARLDRLAHQVDRPRAAARHGDFWPGNVFLDHGRCEVVDYEGLRDGLSGEDVAYFLLHLEGYFPGPVLLPRRRAAGRAFLAGYLSLGRVGASEFRFCRLAAALRIRRHLAPKVAGARRRLLVEAFNA